MRQPHAIAVALKKMFSAVLSVMPVLGLVGASIATPSLAADELTAGAAGATVPMASAALAAMTAPMLAMDTDILADRTAVPTAPDAAADFSDVVADDSEEADVPATLAALVESQETAGTVDAEQECLATSVYFEAKGEPLKGQLAVAETVLNRAQSGRFANSICGVIRQPGQFSFVRGGRVPKANHDSRAWRQAVAIARIAQADLWNDVAPSALFFHATHVRPGFGGKRIARLGNHIFYR